MSTIVQYLQRSVKRRIGICRVSTDQQQSGFSLPAQERAIREHCEANRLELIETIRIAESGHTIGDGICDALDVARSQGAGIIVCFVDRLSRDSSNLERIKAFCDEHCLPLDIIHDGPITPTKGDKEWSSEARRIKGLQTALAVRERQRQGLPHGRPTKSTDAALQRRVWQLSVIEGKGCRAIAKELRTSKSAVGRILSGPMPTL